MTEAQLQSMVVDLAHWCGFLSYHTYDSRKSCRGYPDLTLVHTTNGRLIFAELKSDTGKCTPEQDVWLRHLGIHHEAYLWFPRHWRDETIRRVLTAETRRAAA